MWASGAVHWTQLRAEAPKRVGLLALILVGSASIYFIALWAGGLKFRQFARK
jgi:putative peptidoglycan lipid II flippase